MENDGDLADLEEALRRALAATPGGARGAMSRRRLVLGLVVAAGVAFVVSRIDFGEAIREVTLPLRHEDVIASRRSASTSIRR